MVVRLCEALLADFQHVRVDIEDCDLRSVVSVSLFAVVQESHGDISRTSSNIQEFGSWSRGQGADEMILPKTMDSATHDIVHDVVLCCNVGEHLLNCRQWRMVRRFPARNPCTRGQTNAGKSLLAVPRFSFMFSGTFWNPKCVCASLESWLALGVRGGWCWCWWRALVILEKPADLTGLKVATVRLAKSCFNAVLLVII